MRDPDRVSLGEFLDEFLPFVLLGLLALGFLVALLAAWLS